VNLAFASATALEYDSASWPHAGKLDLSGFRYESLHRWLTAEERSRRLRHADIADFLGVIRRQTLAADGPGYTPRPYEQLARTLREQGEARKAQDVLIARTDDAVRGRPRAVRLGALVLKLAVGYGYRPLRVLVPIAFMLLVGWFVFSYGHEHDSFAPGARVHPPFHPLAYSLDSLVPFIDLGQEKAWTISTAEAGWLATYYWIHVCMGWLLSSFVVLGVTRSARS